MKTQNYFQDLNDWRWKEKSAAIKTRDNHVCQRCGDWRELHVHHRYYEWHLRAWEYPDEALVTLCRDCHQFAKNIKQELGSFADGKTHSDAMLALRDLFECGQAIQARNALTDILSREKVQQIRNFEHWQETLRQPCLEIDFRSDEMEAA